MNSNISQEEKLRVIRERRKKAYWANREENIRKSREWALNNKDKKSEWRKRYQKENAARLAAKRRDYNSRKSDEAKQNERRSKRNWFAKNPEYRRQWNEAHIEAVRKSKRKWDQKNKDERRRLYQEYRAKLSLNTIDGTAETFYQFVRSKRVVPCYYCGKKISGKEAHIDHVIAVARNGNHASQNLCASCPDCNYKKGKKLPSETRFQNQPLLNL